MNNKIFKGKETCFNGYSKITISELQKMSEQRQQSIQKKKILQKNRSIQKDQNENYALNITKKNNKLKFDTINIKRYQTTNNLLVVFILKILTNTPVYNIISKGKYNTIRKDD